MLYNIDVLINELKNGTDSERENVITLLGQMDNDPKALKVLVYALSDRAWGVRTKSANILKKSATDEIIELLISALASNNEDLRYWSAQILASYTVKGVPPLIQALKSTHKETRYYAAMALGKTESKRAVGPLIEALGDESWRVRKSASESLINLGNIVVEDATKALYDENEDRKYWAIKVLGSLGSEATAALIKFLKTGDKEMRFFAAAALGESGDKRVISALINALADEAWLVRKNAAEALIDIGEPAVPFVVDSLKTKNEDVKYWARKIIERLANDNVTQLLVEKLASDDDRLKFQSRKILAQIGVPAIIKLVDVLEDTTKPKEFRIMCAATLGDIRHSLSIEALLRVLSDKHWSIRKYASDSLVHIGEKAVPMLIIKLANEDEDIRYWVTWILEKIGDCGVEPLLKALKDKNKNIRYFVSGALGKTNNPIVVKPLIKCLKDECWAVRQNAANSLIFLKEKAIKELVSFLRDEDEDIRFWVKKVITCNKELALPILLKMLESSYKDSKFYAAHALGMLKDKRAVSALIPKLKDGDEWVRVYVATALGEIGDPKAIPHLVESLNDDSIDMFKNVVKVLGRLGDEGISYLMIALKEGSENTKLRIVEALGDAKDKKAVIPLINMSQDKNAELRYKAVVGLGKLADKRAVMPLIKRLDDGKTKIKIAAIIALGNIKDDIALEPIIEHLGIKYKELHEDIERVLINWGEPCVSPLVRLLGSNDWALRKNAADIVEKIGNKSIPYLKEAAKSEDKNIKFWAAKLIRLIKEKSGNLSISDIDIKSMGRTNLKTDDELIK